MRVGIVRSGAGLGDGGIFQYEQAFLAALGEVSSRLTDELVYLAPSGNDLLTLAGTSGLTYRGLPVQAIDLPRSADESPKDYPAPSEVGAATIDPDRIYYDRAGAERLNQARIDLLLQLSPVAHAFSLRVPFLCPIFDLNHRLQPEFPEVSAQGEIQRREFFYINTCRYATLVLADSEFGKETILSCYGQYIEAERIRVLPYFPPITRRSAPSETDRLRVNRTYSLPDRYFFYPAQFWRHKNHALIIEALDMLRRQYDEDVHVVFCGSYADHHRARNFGELQTLIERLGVGRSVTFLGSVPECDMPSLYAMSAGLCMPTFFGPTNIPPLEAWFYGRPVICSDIPGIREQIGDAGLLVDPRSSAELAAAMLRLWRREPVAEGLIEAGRKRIAIYGWGAYVGGVEKIVREACDRVVNGSIPAFPDLQ